MQNTLTQMSADVQECVYNCLSSHAICLETITRCLSIGGKYADPNHLQLLQDCAQICQTSAAFLLRNSDFRTQISRLCADICELCSSACKAMASGNDFMTRCAEACHRCAESCRQMSLLAGRDECNLNYKTA